MSVENFCLIFNIMWPVGLVVSILAGRAGCSGLSALGFIGWALGTLGLIFLCVLEFAVWLFGFSFGWFIAVLFVAGLAFAGCCYLLKL